MPIAETEQVIDQLRTVQPICKLRQAALNLVRDNPNDGALVWAASAYRRPTNVRGIVAEVETLLDNIGIQPDRAVIVGAIRDFNRSSRVTTHATAMIKASVRSLMLATR